MAERMHTYAPLWIRSPHYTAADAGEKLIRILPQTLLVSVSIITVEPLPDDGLVVVDGWAEAGAAVGAITSTRAPQWCAEETRLSVQVAPEMSTGSCFVLAHVVPLGS